MLCPVCKKPVTWEDNKYRPFCGERCKLIDLGAWADEGYKITGGDNDNDDQSGQDGSED